LREGDKTQEKEITVGGKQGKPVVFEHERSLEDREKAWLAILKGWEGEITNEQRSLKKGGDLIASLRRLTPRIREGSNFKDRTQGR